ncbi:MAG TPA: cytochrome P450, partial [Blastocatellia bacterium]|nr:cytochrome P450 [Blastocatellia bacterium]
GLLARLAVVASESGEQISENEMVAHSNVLFMSSTEPIGVSLTWVLLVLSQLPDLRRDLRHELDQASRVKSASQAIPPIRLPLLDSVINETLRILPPNAFMVRVTRRKVSLDGLLLPERCELVLCPFIAHRDAGRFPRPNEFLPSRWTEARPSPFEYFPFGAGGHACVGRQLAMYMIKSALALLMPRYELVLAGDQEIDWRLHIQFMPKDDPLVTVRAPGDVTAGAGKLLGPIRDLLMLDM